MKRQNETRNRSLISQNAFPPRETDQNFRKTPSRGGKWGKFSEKRLPAAGNGKNSQKNGFPRRESDKISRKTVSRGGKAVKFARDRFPAAGKGANSPKNAFRRAKSIFKKPPSRRGKRPGPANGYNAILFLCLQATWLVTNLRPDVATQPQTIGGGTFWIRPFNDHAFFPYRSCSISRSHSVRNNQSYFRRLGEKVKDVAVNLWWTQP